jgi:hypothetical protein
MISIFGSLSFVRVFVYLKGYHTIADQVCQITAKVEHAFVIVVYLSIFLCYNMEEAIHLGDEIECMRE